MAEQLLNLKLVSEVEKHPCLYNNSLSEYYRKDCSEKAWNAISKAINLPEIQCQEKWRNIRAVFCRHMKPSTKKKRPYYLADAMRFSLPFIRALNPTSHGNSTNIDENEVYSPDFDDEDNSQALAQRSASPPASYQPPSPTPPIIIQPQALPQLDSIPQTLSSSSRQNYRLSTDADESQLEYPKVKRTKTDTSRDYDVQLEYKRMFLLSLLPDLSKMSGPQMRKFRRGVACLIDDILSETPSTSAKSQAQNAASLSSMHSAHSEMVNLGQNEERVEDEHIDNKSDLFK